MEDLLLLTPTGLGLGIRAADHDWAQCRVEERGLEELLNPAHLSSVGEVLLQRGSQEAPDSLQIYFIDPVKGTVSAPVLNQ